MWLESTRLRHQLSELFSVLFMRINSYDPITALYYALGCITEDNSNLMKELPRCQFSCKHDHNNICNNTWSAHERTVSARNAAISLTTLAAFYWLISSLFPPSTLPLFHSFPCPFLESFSNLRSERPVLKQGGFHDTLTSDRKCLKGVIGCPFSTSWYDSLVS